MTLEKGSVTASPTEDPQYDDSTESSSYDEDEREDFLRFHEYTHTNKLQLWQ